jgi:hypothetical protein
VLLFLNSTVFADNFAMSKEISLKKDEQKKILVKYAGEEKLFTFRWTLYVNEGLVVHRSYDRFVAQNILYLNGKNQSVKVVLVAPGIKYYEVPYVLLKFKKFDVKKNEAVFQLFLYDKEKEITWRFLKNK